MEHTYEIITKPELISREKWEQFIRDHPEGNIFQSPEFYEASLHTQYYKPVLLVCMRKKDEVICGILLGVIQSDYKGIVRFFTRRCIITGGPIIAKPDEQTVYSLLLKKLHQLIWWKALFTQFRFFVKPAPEVCDLFIRNNYYYEDYMNILIDTEKSEEELWKEMKKDRRVGINKGKKQGFIFTEGFSDQTFASFFPLLKQSYKRIKKPFPRLSYFEALQKHIPVEKFRCFQLSYQNEEIISLICFLDKKRLYAYYIGINQDNTILNLRPVDYFFWEILRWCRENNVKYYDWMGAGKRSEPYGVRYFKMQYGGELFENGRMSRFVNKMTGALIEFALKIYMKGGKSEKQPAPKPAE